MYFSAQQGVLGHLQGIAGQGVAGHGAAEHLVRQLYISLRGQQKANACQSAIEIPIKPPTGCHVQRGLPILHSRLLPQPTPLNETDEPIYVL